MVDMSDFHRTARWKQLTAEVRPILQRQIDGGGTRCVNAGAWRGCSGWVLPGQRWQVAHILDAVKYPELRYSRTNLGAAHSKCNSSAGGKVGRQRQTRSDAGLRQYPTWARRTS